MRRLLTFARIGEINDLAGIFVLIVAHR